MSEKSKQKVLFVVTKSVWGGAQKYVYDLATNLPKDKFEALVACGGRGPLVLKLEDAGIFCFNIKNFQKDINVLKEILSYFELLLLFLKTRPDIIHTNSSKAAGIAGAAAWDYKFLTLNFKVKNIFTAHGWSFHENRPRWQIKLIKIFSFITAIYYKKIICVSEYDRISAVKNHIAPEKKFVTIRNGIKKENYTFLSKESAREMLRKGNQSGIWIGTVGEFTKNKGHRYLVDAVGKFKIFIIGYGEEEKKEILTQIARLKKEGEIFLATHINNAALYLKAFDIFVFPSLKEGLPYALLEAGLAGLPVVATNVGGIPEIIEDGKTGLLVPPGNAEEIKSAIEKFIADPNLKEKSAEALHQKILNEFGFEKMLDATLAAYQ